jgi:hypothetical protein
VAKTAIVTGASRASGKVSPRDRQSRALWWLVAHKPLISHFAGGTKARGAWSSVALYTTHSVPPFIEPQFAPRGKHKRKDFVELIMNNA